MAHEIIELALSPQKRKRLASLELVIDTGLDSFLEVGQALAAIVAEELWRPHRSFKAYLKVRWPELSRSRAYEAIQHAKIYERVSAIADRLKPWHTRELGSFPAHLHQEILVRAVEFAGTPEDLTAPIINRAGLEVSVDSGSPRRSR